MVFTSQVLSKPATGLFRLKPACQVSVGSQLRTQSYTCYDNSMRNSPLFPPNEELLLHKNHVLKGYPDQQGGGSDIGNGRGHNQPVGCATITGRLCRGFHLCYDDGEPLHDNEKWHAHACKLQHLAQGKLQSPPWAHAVVLQKKKKKGGRRGPLSHRGNPLSLWGLIRPWSSALCASTSIFHTSQLWLFACPTAYTALGIV